MNTMTTDMDDAASICKISELFNKYKGNEYMTNRIHNHIMHILPNTLEIERNNFIDRTNRINTLLADQEVFVRVFLSKNKYYYLHSTNCFYEYKDDFKYKVVKEDDIHHKLLSNITEDRKIVEWKHKTKINVIKQIKERNLFTSVPHTQTIQSVLNMLYPAFFPSKSAVKYFLTIIGDNILKKVTPIKILNKQSQLFNELDTIIFIIGSNTITHNFISKYHDTHNYLMYRLLPINENCSFDIWKDVIGKLGLNLLCVAAHYSNQYDNSENYLSQNTDETLTKYTLFLNNNSQHEIITQFVKSTLVKVEDDSFEISWKNIHYIWKNYLSTLKLPTMIYSNSLKNILKTHIEFDEARDVFTKVTSKFLPSIREFICFWETHIYTSDSVKDIIEELEINELYELFKKVNPTTTITENETGKLISHFFQDIKIIENKYLLNITCNNSLWNRKENIIQSLEKYKIDVSKLETKNMISFDELYICYTKYCNESHYLIVNKKYFDKYIIFLLKPFIIFDTFISENWFISYDV